MSDFINNYLFIIIIKNINYNNKNKLIKEKNFYFYFLKYIDFII